MSVVRDCSVTLLVLLKRFFFRRNTRSSYGNVLVFPVFHSTSKSALGNTNSIFNFDLTPLSSHTLCSNHHWNRLEPTTWRDAIFLRDYLLFYTHALLKNCIILTFHLSGLVFWWTHCHRRLVHFKDRKLDMEYWDTEFFAFTKAAVRRIYILKLSAKKLEIYISKR